MAPFRPGTPRHTTSPSRHRDGSDYGNRDGSGGSYGAIDDAINDPIDPLFGFGTAEALEILAHSCTGAYILLGRVADGETLTAEELDYLGDIARRLLVLRHFFDQHPLD